MPQESPLLLCGKPAQVIKHENKLVCGYYTIAWIASIYGIDAASIIPYPRGIIGRWMPQGVTPPKAISLLRRIGVRGDMQELKHAGNAARIGFLQREMRLSQPVLMCVYGIGRMLPHWIVLAGMNTYERTYYVYDPRTSFGWGKPGTTTSEKPGLPIGNRVLGEGELMQLWAGCHFDILGKYRFLAVSTTKKKIPL